MLCAHRVLAASTNALQATPFAARYDIGALQRGTFKNSTLGVFINLVWSVFGNSGSGHVRNSELGTTFGGHSELGAFGHGGAIGP